MKTEVDNYRGYEIRFDTDNETFECDIDDSRSVKKSYPAVKKFIDDFIKDNSEFKPFKVVANIASTYSFGGNDCTITGVRKDGRFVGEKADGKKIQISDYEMDRYMIPNSENDSIIVSIRMAEQSITDLNKRIRQLKSTLAVTTLKDIWPKYKPL